MSDQSDAGDEQVMLVKGVNRYQRRIQGATERGNASLQSKAGSNLVGLLTSRASKSIQAELEAEPSAGHGQRVNPLIAQAGVNEAVAIAARVFVDRIAFSISHQSLSSVLASVGAAVHEQAWISAFSRIRGKRLLEVVKQRNKDSLYGTSKMKRLIRAELGEDWEDWTKTDRMRVGAKLVTHLLWASDLFEVVHSTHGRRRMRWISPTDTLLEQLRAQDLRVALSSPMFLPLTEPPLPWVAPTVGGYHTLVLPLVKGARGSRLRNLDEHGMPEVYDAVNRLQRVPYCINEGVLTVAEHLWQNGDTIAGLPPQDPLPVPAFPPDQEGTKWTELTDLQKEARKNWKASASQLHAIDRSNSGKSLAIRTSLETAQTLSGQTIWLPLQLDFRGRVYPIPAFSYQADKLTKALIQFDKGEPLTERGIPWFLIHGANSWGLDKLSFEDRIDWVYENEDRIIQCSEDPIEDLWWTGADEPWAFLAWVIEAGEWFEGGRSGEFISHLPVASDATCSALQHWSAALRDLEGARTVNLTPGPRSDVYTDVLNTMRRRLEESGSKQALWLLDSPYFTRSLVKTPMMARTYSGTRRGVEEHVGHYTRQTDNSYCLQGFCGSGVTTPTIKWIAAEIWESIDQCLTGAVAGMEFAQDVAKIANALNYSLSWVTPTGMLVQTDYQQLKARRITTHLLGEVYTPRLYERGDALDKRRQLSSVAPNLIHSLDASQLMRSVNRVDHPVMTIHDSFGVHARHADTFNLILREEFVRLYEQDVLADWAASCLPFQLTAVAGQEVIEMLNNLKTPEKGSLDIQDVLNAAYAFS